MDQKTKDTILKAFAIIGVIAVLLFGGFITVFSLRSLPTVASNLRAQVINITQRFIPNQDNENGSLAIVEEDESVEPISSSVSLEEDENTPEEKEEVKDTNTISPATPPTTAEREAGEETEESIVFNETEASGGATNTGTSDPLGKVDLRAEILEVGYIDRVTNIFTATSTISSSQRAAIRFVVENVGTRVVNSWSFNVVLPTNPSYIYHSKLQQALLPGDRIEYTMGFDSIRSGNDSNIITVNVDPTSSVSESDETNNIVKAELPAFTN